MSNGLRWKVSVCCGVAAILALTACDSPSFVDEVEVANPGEYSADVAVQGRPQGSRLSLGFVGPRSSREFREVIDQGESWTFIFDHVGLHEEAMTLTRGELEAAGWRVEVPESFTEALREMGRSPST